MKINAMVGPSPPPIPWSAPGKFITLGSQDSLVQKYHLLPRREASAQELRVQALWGQLVRVKNILFCTKHRYTYTETLKYSITYSLLIICIPART